MNVALLDFGSGSLHGLAALLRGAGASVRIESDLGAATEAAALVVPAPGAFGPAAARLAPAQPLLHQVLTGGRPCLALGVGMQLLFEGSDEAQGAAGLGVIPGFARRLATRRVPHMGWNDVEPGDHDPLFDEGGLCAWYASSYAVEPADPGHVIAWTTYDGFRFPAAVRTANVWGLQFQPDKSGPSGARMIARFLELARAA